MCKKQAFGLLFSLCLASIQTIQGWTMARKSFILSAHSPDTSDATQTLLEHLQMQECEGLDTTQVAYDEAGVRGIFAKQDFEPGDYICAIPFPATLLIEDSIDGDDSQAGLKFLDTFCQEDNYKYYMNCLPKINDAQFDATPDFWEESVIQELQIPRLIETSLQCKRETAHLLDLQWATWIICSRGFSTFKVNQDGSLKRRIVLIPYLDMLNHAVSPNASIEVVECPGSCQDSFYALQALKSISAGEQITIGYGIRETSLDLLSKYGFWLPDNPADDYIDWNMVDPQWTTTTEQDKATLETITDGALRQVLLLRIHLKQLRSKQQ